MDTFFVSVERLHQPDLRGRPVVVGSDNPQSRGVVAAASYEARAFGVRSAMPLRQAWRLCPQAAFVAGHPDAYVQASREIRAICENAAPLVEMGSLDEAWLDLTGSERLYPSAGTAADLIENRVARELGLPVSFGWGENKLLAKVASARSKPHGMLRVYPGQGRAFLAPLPLRSLPGVGPKNAELLGRYGLRLVGEIERLGERFMRDALGEVGRVLFHRARGDDDSPVVPHSEAQTIGHEHTFENDTANRLILLSTLSRLGEKVAARLRRAQKRATRVLLKLRYSDFKTVTRTVVLPAPANDDQTLYQAAVRALDAALDRRVRVRLLGLTAKDLCSDAWTLDLFELEKRERIERLGRCLDRIRQNHGFWSIQRGRTWEGRENPAPPPV
jgi:DNA polymerase-4